MPAVAAHAAETAEHGSAGMPQLDVSTYTSQIFWLVVFFAVLYHLVANVALPKLTEVFEERQERMSADLDKAAELRAEAEAAYERYEAALADAHTEGQAALAVVRERMGREHAARQAELDARLAEKVSEAEARIASARDQAMSEIEDVAIEAAQSAVERLIGIKVTKAQAKSALTAVMKEAA